MSAGSQRVRARVGGTVQGVGFRPYVFRLAANLRLSGFVLNDERGVLLEIEGESATVEQFLERLPAEAPPLSQVEEVWREEVPTTGELGFRIVASASGGESATLISPDSATCSDCLAELWDSADRRFRYPFINCTNCGPRFTIVRQVPYDRSLTTMAGFDMCGGCRAEYEDPSDRRFHAQPNACPACGPTVRLTDPAGRPVGLSGARDPVEAAARALA
ncbi:MAG TPA: acylphosphatase, partial [Gemmatimonadales bacterium]|nr:acylphosphatase [Gemmatimonadales bacterium]